MAVPEINVGQFRISVLRKLCTRIFALPLFELTLCAVGVKTIPIVLEVQ